MRDTISHRNHSSENSAPAVRYLVGRSFFQRRFLVVLGVTGVLVGGLWIRAMATVGWTHIIYFSVLLSVMALAIQSWKNTPTGLLVWGGQTWAWQSNSMPITGSMKLHGDVQFLMVLTLKDDHGRSIWIWAERASDPANWIALRRAVYADKRTKTASPNAIPGVGAETSL